MINFFYHIIFVTIFLIQIINSWKFYIDQLYYDYIIIIDIIITLTIKIILLIMFFLVSIVANIIHFSFNV